jgi:hypothetical protein
MNFDKRMYRVVQGLEANALMEKASEMQKAWGDAYLEAVKNFCMRCKNGLSGERKEEVLQKVCDEGKAGRREWEHVFKQGRQLFELSQS